MLDPKKRSGGGGYSDVLSDLPSDDDGMGPEENTPERSPDEVLADLERCLADLRIALGQ